MLKLDFCHISGHAERRENLYEGPEAVPSTQERVTADDGDCDFLADTHYLIPGMI